MDTIGTITSKSNEKGEHSLKCPVCDSFFLKALTPDDPLSGVDNICCPTCGHMDQPLTFLCHAQKEKTDKIAHDFVDQRIKSFLNNHTINLKL